MFTKILFCSDGSEDSLRAAEMAAGIATRFDSHLIVLHVFNPTAVAPPYLGIPGGPFETAVSFDAYADETYRSVEVATAVVLDKAGVRYTFQRELGHPVDRITAVSKDTEADLVVIGSRGLSEWKSFLLGSVSTGVLHHVQCPVLVVR